MDDLPKHIADQFGAWWGVIASAIIGFSLTAGGGVGAAAWWLVKKIHSGSVWLCDLLKMHSDAYLESNATVKKELKSQSSSLSTLAVESEKQTKLLEETRENTKETMKNTKEAAQRLNAFPANPSDICKAQAEMPNSKKRPNHG